MKQIQGQATQEERAQTEDAEGGVRSDYGNSTYPLELATTKQDYIKFSMVRYQPKGLSTREWIWNWRGRC